MYGLLLLVLSAATRSFGLKITTSIPGNVQRGDSVSVFLTHSEGDPANFYLSMSCTSSGETNKSVSNVANFTSNTTEDIPIVSLGNCTISALLQSESQADTLLAESQPFNFRGSSSESQSSSTSAVDHVTVMIDLALGATSFLGVLGIILYLFLQRTQATLRNRLNTKLSPITDPESSVIMLPPDQRLSIAPPKSLESNRGVRHFSLISRRMADVPTAVQSLGTSVLSQYSTTTNESLTLLAFPLPPAARQSELQELVTRFRRELSLRSTKFSSEERWPACEERLHKQIAGMRSEIAYLTAQLDLAWAMGSGQMTPSAYSSCRRSAESGTLSVHSRAPQVSHVVS
ncbi:hypothetical protein DFS33DRAFT_227272 [Desarmillaria ectypa]|nr:hypothetical protein DFS33DRAFT_227272 [Desarmillaria ectypa]